MLFNSIKTLRSVGITYLETVCPHCGQPIASDVVISYQKTTTPAATCIVVKNVEVQYTIPIDDLVRDVIDTIRSYIWDGISMHELCELIKTKFSITKTCCRDIIERIITELNLYSPDMEHLYYISCK